VTAVLFRPAYLKIFLIASPAFCLLLALGVAGWRRDWLGWLWSMMALGLIIWPMGLSLQAYYDDPRFQRDNYRGIAAYIEAVATGADAVVLNAPGQQEVFGYYYQSGPHQAAVYPLPQQRPLNPAATQAELAAIQAESKRLYAVYWATEEADPTGLIEDWLDENTFKANDIWFGNVRLVSYATANQEIPITDRGVNFGRQVELLGAGFAPQTIAPGEILQIRLIWQSDTVLSEDYTVFIQLLDSTNHLVGQRDAQPQPSTSAWSAGQPVVDDHGLYLEPGTPPGIYSLIAGLYHSRTGERLRVSAAPDGNDFLTLGTIEVTRREKPLPIEAFRMQHRLNGPPLRGYDLYKLGHASEPMGRLQPGDPLHLNLYWQQSDQLAGIETVDIQLLDRHGQVIRNWADQPLAAGYPSEAWSAGEIVRSQYDFFLNDVGPGQYQLAITLGSQTINVAKEVVVGEP
jgi:hypothetical protein